MRSRIQHSWVQWFVAACAACSVSVVACSDEDPETEVDPLQGASGNAGSSSNAGAAGSAGSGGASTGCQGGNSGGAAAGSGAGGAAAGSSAGGSANAAGAAGTAGAAGAAGSGPDVGEPDAGGGEEPEEGQFTAAFQVLRNNCVPCHANGGGLPQFAQVDEDLAFAVTQGNGAGGVPIYDRIIARAVTARTMPPTCNGGAFGTGTCLTTDEAETLEDWVADGALR
jgi:hypothetical protein